MRINCGLCFLLVFHSLGFSSLACPISCRCNGNTLHCHKIMPDVLPKNVTELIYYGVSLGDVFNFTHASWLGIHHLSINPEPNILQSKKEDSGILHNNEFSPMKNLEFLQVSCDCLKEIQENAFHGLNSLEVLDLSHNKALSIDSVLKALSKNGTLPKLRELYLSSTSTDVHTIGSSSMDFQRAMTDKPIEVFDVSNFRNAWYLGSIDILTSMPLLKTLNISNSSINIFSLHAMYNENISMNLEELDASYPTFFMPFNNYGQDFMLDMYTEYLKPYNLTKLHAKKVLNFPSSINGTSNSTHLCLGIMFRDGTRKNCVKANVNRLEKLVISDNSVYYFQPEIWNGFTSLRYLDISKNYLGETMSKPGYGRSILERMDKLEVLIIAENRIFEIPKDTFESSKCLKILDLSGNNLQSVTFETNFLLSIEKLDLSRNKIVVLDETSLFRLDSLLKLPFNSTHRKTEANVLLSGNLFICSCDIATFLYWLANLNHPITCQSNAGIKLIDNTFVQNMQYLCKENLVIGVFSVFGFIVIVLTIIFVFLIIRKRRNVILKKLIMRGIEKFRLERRNKQTPPVFLSFCSEDDDLVMNEIFPQLDEGLKKVLNTEIRCVSTGYHDFRPGLPLGEEIIRCVEASSVIVFFVTKAFCRKMWCRHEALIAHYDNKPTVLMMWEHVDIKLLPKHLHKCYQEFVRVHWVQENELRIMRPNWEDLSEEEERPYTESEAPGVAEADFMIPRHGDDQEECSDCFCAPCITDESKRQMWWPEHREVPKHVHASKRKRLNQRFWSMLHNCGAWRDVRYLAKK